MTHKRKQTQYGLLPKILILAGIAVVIGVVFVIKNQPAPAAAPEDESMEELLDRSIEEGKPVFAFFHSTNCHSCTVMMKTVYEVYPEFSDDIVLVDVDVYDPQNDNLMRRGQINSIPTQVFIGRDGAGKVAIGVMDAALLRERLQGLIEAP